MVFLIGSVALGFVIVAWRLARRLGIAERELREVRLLGRELRELRDEPILIHCAAGGRSVAACETLGRRGYTGLLNLVGGFHAWCGPREQDGAPGSSDRPDATGRAPVAFGGGPVSEAAVVAAIRE